MRQNKHICMKDNLPIHKTVILIGATTVSTALKRIKIIFSSNYNVT